MYKIREFKFIDMDNRWDFCICTNKTKPIAKLNMKVRCLKDFVAAVSYLVAQHMSYKLYWLLEHHWSQRYIRSWFFQSRQLVLKNNHGNKG